MYNGDKIKVQSTPTKKKNFVKLFFVCRRWKYKQTKRDEKQISIFLHSHNF